MAQEEILASTAFSLIFFFRQRLVLYKYSIFASSIHAVVAQLVEH